MWVTCCLQNFKELILVNTFRLNFKALKLHFWLDNNHRSAGLKGLPFERSNLPDRVLRWCWVCRSCFSLWWLSASRSPLIHASDGQCVCEALARPDEGVTLTGRDNRGLSQQQARQRIEVTSANPEPTKRNASSWAALVCHASLREQKAESHFLQPLLLETC